LAAEKGERVPKKRKKTTEKGKSKSHDNKMFAGTNCKKDLVKRAKKRASK